jgi:hypothetical protein
MGLKGQERRLGFEPMLTAQEVAATSSGHPAMARHWRVEGIGPAYFKIGPLNRYPAWKLERRLPQVCRPQDVA